MIKGGNHNELAVVSVTSQLRTLRKSLQRVRWRTLLRAWTQVIPNLNPNPSPNPNSGAMEDVTEGVDAGDFLSFLKGTSLNEALFLHFLLKTLRLSFLMPGFLLPFCFCFCFQNKT
jgi:hypothetical protein